MKRDTISLVPVKSSFLSCEKDLELILRKLFIEHGDASKALKKLLVVANRDCLDQKYTDVENMSLASLIQDGYVISEPKIALDEHEQVKSYLLITFDNFVPSSNPEFRDCTVSFDILCHIDQWDLGNYRKRPIKIVGYIDAILNNAKLTGIGEFQFLGCSQLILNEEFSGYTLTYAAVHGSDDLIPSDEE